MPAFDTLLGFFAVSLLLGFTPGPDNLFVLMQSASQGRRAGLHVILGLATGLVVHTSAVALGLAALFAASVTAFTVLKFAGAGYLAYLAWQAWRAPVADAETAPVPPLSPRQLYLRGLLMNLTNPKVVLFFLAFLPQFVQPERGPVAAQVICFGLVFIGAALVSFGTITFFADWVGRRLRSSPRAQRAMNRATAFMFAGLALRLAVSER